MGGQEEKEVGMRRVRAQVPISDRDNANEGGIRETEKCNFFHQRGQRWTFRYSGKRDIKKNVL
jgi:hypothetical protein